MVAIKVIYAIAFIASLFKLQWIHQENQENYGGRKLAWHNTYGFFVMIQAIMISGVFIIASI